MTHRLPHQLESLAQEFDQCFDNMMTAGNTVNGLSNYSEYDVSLYLYSYKWSNVFTTIPSGSFILTRSLARCVVTADVTSNVVRWMDM